MTTRTTAERAQQSIRGYDLTAETHIKINPKTIKTAITLGIINLGHQKSPAPNLSSWIDLKLNEEIERVLLEKVKAQ